MVTVHILLIITQNVTDIVAASVASVSQALDRDCDVSGSASDRERQTFTLKTDT